MAILERLHDSDSRSRHEIAAKRKRSGLRAVGCIFDRHIHYKPCSVVPHKAPLWEKNKMFFVNKSSCISIMKSFSSTVVKDILSSPLGEDRQRKRSGQ